MNKCSRERERERERIEDNLQKNDILSFGCQATTIASWIKRKRIR